MPSEIGRSVQTVADPPFVPTDFVPPTALVSDHFRLEPLGPQHNEADHAAWTSSITHIRSTPGFPDGNWPPPEGMSLDRNLDDLRRHAADFEARTGHVHRPRAGHWRRDRVRLPLPLGVAARRRHGSVVGAGQPRGA